MLRLNGRQLFPQLLEEHRFFVPPADIGDEGVQDRGYCTRIGAGPSAGYAICAQQDWGAPALQSDPLFENAKSLLSYVPAYEPEHAILESVRWLIDHDELEVTGMLLA